VNTHQAYLNNLSYVHIVLLAITNIPASLEINKFYPTLLSVLASDVFLPYGIRPWHKIVEVRVNFASLIKMKCCIVAVSIGITALLVLKHNAINAGVSGTVALIYTIALCMLLCIGVYDKIVNRNYEASLSRTEE